jgi:hypothetical protein
LFWDYTLKITRRNRRFDLLPNEHLPVVKVLLAETSHELPTPGRRIVSSEPLVGGLEVEGTDQGVDASTDRYSSWDRGPVPDSSEGYSIGGKGVGEMVATGGVGGDEETRTPDPLLAKEMLCQLSYVPLPVEVVGVSGLEPETSALSGQCSNQLS